MFQLDGKPALVTGASGGIGAAIVRALHAQGAVVVLSGTRRGALDSLAAELGAPSSAPGSSTINLTEDYILGGADAPEVPADVRYPATEVARSPAEMPLAPQNPARAPVEQKKGGWGLFGRKKAAPAPDMRAEPAPTYPKPQPQRSANVQPMPAEKPATPPKGDDLFPEHGSDDQFEIPAFLRRQSGQ